MYWRCIDAIRNQSGVRGEALTEEHFWSILFATMGDRVADANDTLKRIWTSPLRSTVAPGDEDLALWHLPAEKRYGFSDLFHTLARNGFPAGMNADEFRALEGRCAGLPRKTAAKVLRDGLRQVASRLGLRT